MSILRSGGLASGARLPIVKIEGATFYRHFPHQQEGTHEASNPRIFPNLTFSLPLIPPEPLPYLKDEPQNWAVVGPSSSGKTTFLQILRGQHLCFPPTARSFPRLSSSEIPHRLRSPANAIRHAGFDGERRGLGGPSARGSYLSARYESRREETDFSLLDYLKGHTSLNPLDDELNKVNEAIEEGSLEKVVADLGLQPFMDMPIGTLSNGQMRRAMIAKAVVSKPELLLLDEPFMGLDPSTLKALIPLLEKLALSNSPRILLALRPQDPLPDWITHVLHLSPELRVAAQGPKEEVLRQIHPPKSGKYKRPSRLKHPSTEEEQDQAEKREALVEMEGVQVKYGQKIVLGGWNQLVDGERKPGLYWTVRRGDRWGIFGPNGSGKTTILSLICSDHPQAYSLPIRIFGQSRLPQLGRPGISVFDIQARIGHSSPEVHAFFPRKLTIRQTIENAWADTFLGKPKMSYEDDSMVDDFLRWFRPELDPASCPQSCVKLNMALKASPTGARSTDTVTLTQYTLLDTDWADEIRFGEVPFSSQRVALFLRAIVKRPDLVVLDEAFSGMDEVVRNKCMLFLRNGMMTWKPYDQPGATAWKPNRVEKSLLAVTDKAIFQGLSKEQALICISHVREEVPAAVTNWMCLPEAGSASAVRFGRLPERPWTIYGDEDLAEQQWCKIWGITPARKSGKSGFVKQ